MMWFAKRPLLAFLFLLLFVALWSPTLPARAENDWRARYWNNTQFAGDPVLDRYESNIFYNWGNGSPDELVNPDGFSAIWEKNIVINQAGWYRFTVTSDDGMRVFIKNQPIINVWYDTQAHTVTADVYLEAGQHPTRVEYYEAGGGAVAQVGWQPVTAINGWKGEYFNNTALAYQPVLIRDDAAINFQWGFGSPLAGTVNNDDFSVRWTRNLLLEAGTYRFSVTVDDGVRLWVNGQLLLDRWQSQPLTTLQNEIVVVGGSVPVRMEYFEQKDNATAVLTWEKVSAGTTPPLPLAPAVVNWNASYYNNFSLDGAPVAQRVDPQIHFTWGSSSPIPNVLPADNFSVRWNKELALPAGNYAFTTTVEGGVRLYVNGQLVIDDWNPQFHVVQRTAVVPLPGGAVPVVMEFRKSQGLAQAWLDWANTAVVPTVPATSPTAPGASTANLTGTQAQMTGAIHLTMREGPGVDFTPVGYLSRNEVVTMLGRDVSGVWVQVQRSDGTVGWVSGRYLVTAVPVSSLPVTAFD